MKLGRIALVAAIALPLALTGCANKTDQCETYSATIDATLKSIVDNMQTPTVALDAITSSETADNVTISELRVFRVKIAKDMRDLVLAMQAGNKDAYGAAATALDKDKQDFKIFCAK